MDFEESYLKKVKDVKITIVGAGSAFAKVMIADIMSNEDLRNYNCTVSLVDTDEQALSVIAEAGEKIRKYYKSTVKIEKTTDRTSALPGTDFVISAVERDRMRLWEQDFRVPLAFGFKHVLGENGGPGSLFHALRNYKIILPICEDIERLCPNALVLNFSNPESRILMAMKHLTRINAVGLCHGVLNARTYVADLVGRRIDELDMITGGINHFFWFLKIADAKTGEDLYPLVRKNIRKSGSAMVKKMLEVFDYLIHPSDNHIGEYLSYGYEFFDGLILNFGVEGNSVDKRANAGRWRDEYLAGNISDKDLAKPSDEIAIDIITDVLMDKNTWQPTVNVLNEGFYIENLPAEAIIEVPARVNASGVHPEKAGPLPEALAAMCRTQISIQLLLLQAYQNRSKKLLLQALLLDPVVNNVSQAEKMLDYMFKIQKDYLPEFGD